MRCERAMGLLHPFIDGELGYLPRQLLLRHLGRCPACTARLAALQSLQATLREGLAYHRAPPALAARIGAALAREGPPPAPAGARITRRAFPLAATGIAGALAGVALTLLVAQPPSGAEDNLAGAVIDSHIRSLLPGHLMEVESTDRHTVKPWLSARLDVSPPVRDLADMGFPLLGGRLDYVAGHRVACVVYRRDRHIINLLAWASPGAPDSGFSTLSRQGFNLVTWRREGETFWVVSDLEPAELARFARMVAGDA